MNLKNMAKLDFYFKSNAIQDLSSLMIYALNGIFNMAHFCLFRIEEVLNLRHINVEGINVFCFR